MNFYQVNQRQRKTFEREFNEGYLCSPSGNWGGWPLMMALRSGDILFHYNSRRQAVLGISRVTNIGQHKGTSSQTAVLTGTQCIKYSGRHLSEDYFSPKRREHFRQNYPSYFEVHTVRLHGHGKANLGKSLTTPRQVYLVSISDAEARSFLKKWGLENLS